MKEDETSISEVPTLILTPAQEKQLDPSKSQLKHQFPNHHEIIIPGGHGAVLNFPDEYNRAIISWINETVV